MRTLSLWALLLTSSLSANTIDIYFGTGGPPAEGIYRGTFDSEKGTLANIQLAADIERPGFLALHPKRTHLYSLGRKAKQGIVAAYAIEKDGSLKLVNEVTIPDGGAAHIAVHPSGKFLLTAQYGGGSVAVFPLEADGKLKVSNALHKHEGGSGVVPKRQSNPHPHWVGFSPDGKFALVPDLGLDQIVIYGVDVDKGELKKAGVAQSVPGGGPRHMRFSVDGKFIYLLNELSLSVTTFAYDAKTGSAKPLATTPSLSDAVKAKESFNSASEILVHPNGKFVYSANRGHDSVTVYEADPETGKLKVVEVEPIRGSWPRNINLTQDGKWLLAAGAKSNTVAVFNVDSETGELRFPRNHVYSVPNVICVLPNE
jgi:6-phosphogluconolactonase